MLTGRPGNRLDFGEFQMGNAEELGWSARSMKAQSSEVGLSRTASCPTLLASPQHCAYNQTRECFLALEVLAEEFSFADIGDILAKRSFRSGEGIWLKPFHGIPTTDLFAPLDLIYLDSHCRVIEVVESFPTFLATSLISRAVERTGSAGTLYLFVANATRRSTDFVRC